MLSQAGLTARVNNLKAHLKNSERKFNETREELKSLKREITNTKGAILEVESLLLKAV